MKLEIDRERKGMDGSRQRESMKVSSFFLSQGNKILGRINLFFWKCL